MFRSSRFFQIIFLAVSMSFSGLSTSLQAQTLKAFEKAGDKAFGAKDYYTAYTHYFNASQKAPGEIRLWYKQAEAARNFNAYELATGLIEKVVAADTAEQFPLAWFHLGQLRKVAGRYDEAIDAFATFLASQKADAYYSAWAKAEIMACRWAKNATPPDSLNIRVEHLDKRINTPYSEFGPLPLGDTLFYSSYRYEFSEDKHRPKRKLSKVLMSKKLSRGRLVPGGFNVPGKHTAHATISPDGSRIYFTVCEYVSDSDIRCQIFYREKGRRGRWKREPRPMESNINVPGYTATQPCSGFDSTLQKEWLFFVSDRPGGKGKLDIWYTILDQGKFAEPVNLEAVNTPENEITPFFDSRRQVLYFSSDRHPGLGGYDIFQIIKGEQWGSIENLGPPVNSPFNDLYYAPSENGQTAWLSSNRPGSFYLDANNKACCYDLWRVFYEEKKDGSTTVPAPPLPAPVAPPAPDQPTELEDFLPLKLYFDNDEPDRRTRRRTTRKNYAETFSKFYQRKAEYLRRFTEGMDDEAASDASLAIEAFFDEELKKGMDRLNLFCEILLQRLEKGDTVEIVLKGFTSPRAETDYNDRLAQRRIACVRNHFKSWKNGAFERYLKSKQLIISEAPFGETMVSSPVSDDLKDERNSIYSVEASRERRVEIVEVK